MFKLSETLPAGGLNVKLRSSSQLIALYSCFFVLVFIALFLLPLQLWQKILLSLVLIIYAQSLFSKQLLFNHPQAIRQLAFTELLWCHIRLKNGQILKVDILPDTILTEHLVILNLQKRVEHTLLSSFFNKYSVLINVDTVGAEPFRQLKCHLRLMKFSKVSEDISEL